MTIEDRARINLILERHHGNLELVARALEMTPQNLRQQLVEDPAMKARWINHQINPHDRPALDLDLVDQFAPQTEPSALPPKEQLLIEGAKRQDDKLAKLDWHGLGIKDEEDRNLLQSFEQFVGGKIVSTLDATHGGMLFAFGKTASLYRKVSQELERLGSTVGEDGQVLFNQFAACSHLMIKLNAEATKAGHLRVLMEGKAREVAAKKRTKKPGFGRPRNVTSTGSEPQHTEAVPAPNGEAVITLDPSA